MKLKAGRYYVGDPCYVIRSDWEGFLHKTDFGNTPLPEEGIVIGSTAYGDGVYTDNFGRDYCVDAGLIGVLHESYIEDDFSGLGHLVEFKEDFEVDIHNGVFKFGPITIDTSYDDDEYDEENYF